MISKFLIGISIVLFLHPLSARADGSLHVSHRRDSGYQACAQVLLESVTFPPVNSKSRHGEEIDYASFCSTEEQPALGSMAHCLIDSFKNSNKYVEAFVHSCGGSLTVDDVHESYNNATQFLVNLTSISDIGVMVFKPVAVPVKKVQDLSTLIYNSGLNDNYDLFFGITMVSYWFVIMLIAAVNHWFYYLFPNVVKSMHGSLINGIRRSFILAPSISKHHAQVRKFKFFQWFVPLRFEALVILGWLVLAIVFCSVGYQRPTIYFMALPIGSRSGLLLVYSLPVLVLFPGRNNFMQWVTGWSQARFLLFHRWMARIMFLLTLVHVTSKTIGLHQLHGYSYYMHHSFIRWGVVGAVSIGVIVFQSMNIFRSINYEFFVLTHIILAIIFILSGWKHASDEEINSPQSFYAAAAVWGLDRVLRIIRIISFGVKNATVELQTDEILKVTVNRPKHWVPHPGAHAFIHFLRPSYFWQSHPFTIVDCSSEQNTIRFYIKVKGGVTHGLYKHLQSSPNGTDNFKVLIEGPYSQRLPIHKFDNLVFFSSQTGIPGLYSEAMSMAQNKDTSNKRIKFYWVIRELKSLEWFYDELMKFKGTNVEPVIYVSKPESDVEYLKDSEMGKKRSGSNSDQSEKRETYLSVHEKKYWNERSSSVSSSRNSILQRSLSFVEFRTGRPNISDIVKSEIECSEKSVALVACAAPCIVDDIRDVIREVLGKDTSKRIEFFDEMQEW
ncbi:hypothetical protein G9P44_005319 [Scheffersomyces stipitis]|nr:hypothetical protein G9P44_005319 [Scheffersomyces stipitis]